MSRKIKYYTQTQLIKDRNWTKTKIAEWLGEPDKEATNPHYSSGAKVKLYHATRVHRQEKNRRFKLWFEKHIKSKKRRVESAIKSSEIKRGRLILFIKNIDFDIPDFESEKEMYREAIDHYNTLWELRGRYDKFITSEFYSLDPDFLKRISINMLRHSVYNYDLEIERMFGKIGKDEAYSILKERVIEEIYQKYPFLKE